MFSHLLTFAFVRSVWKTEQLSAFQAEGAKRKILQRERSSNVHLKNRLRLMHPCFNPSLADAFSPVYDCLRSLGLENRATIGFPSRGSEARNPPAETFVQCALEESPSANAPLLCPPLANALSPVYVCLRSLGLENIVARLSKPRERRNL